jgi:hypothetical protein
LAKRQIFVTVLTMFLVGLSCSPVNTKYARAWSNGGYSADPSNPDYGTHDWIAQHALDWLSAQEKQYITNNLATYLYGTELPDNGGAPDGIGDTVLHHVYYWSNESMQDDASAIRAQTEFDTAISYIQSGNDAMASKTIGIMSHYIVDVGVFGHVMGGGTDWGPEIHHSDYENYVNERTNSYADDFNTYLVFDGNLETISAYNATLALAYDTTFDAEGDLTCVWMDQNYNWSNTTFKDRCGDSLNHAVNILTDVLHTFYMTEAFDVAVEVISTKATVGQGYNTSVYVKVDNQGESTETFDVTLYADTASVKTQAITLTGRASANITFTWNTTGWAIGNYTISVVSDTIPNETDTEDNTDTDGIVRVGIPGDVDPADGYVGIDDIFAIASHFGQEPGHPSWNPIYDIANDNYVGIDDIFTAASHFGQEENP